jgi:hypothetical protein
MHPVPDSERFVGIQTSDGVERRPIWRITRTLNARYSLKQPKPFALADGLSMRRALVSLKKTRKSWKHSWQTTHLTSRFIPNA